MKNIICNAGKSDGDFVTRVLGGLFGRDDAEPLVFPPKNVRSAASDFTYARLHRRLLHQNACLHAMSCAMF